MFKRRQKKERGIDLHEILHHRKLRSMTISDTDGRINLPISSYMIYFVFFCIISILFLLLARVGYLQLIDGEKYREISLLNISNREILFADRGLIYDRNKKLIAWNEKVEDQLFKKRVYVNKSISLIGSVRYPKKDNNNKYYVHNIQGIDGVERRFDSILKGENGALVNESSAMADIPLTPGFREEAEGGTNIHLAIDLDLQNILYKAVSLSVRDRGYESGVGVVMDVDNGDLLALVEYPHGKADVNGDFSYGIHKSVSGLFTPGSTVKPFFALAALEEDIITPDEYIYSGGSLVLENPYNPDKPSIFEDWKAHGYVNLTDALAVSSNIYFYEIGGGFKKRKGLGIRKMNDYAKLFGFGQATETGVAAEPDGLVPSPEWKEKNFGDPWRVGDTYNTVIGQYGFVVTPLQMARAVSSLANGGFRVEPSILKNGSSKRVKLAFEEANIAKVKEGMRFSVTSPIGSTRALDFNGVSIAAKTGTAQVNKSKGIINSLVIGFYPYKAPRYAFVLIMERGYSDPTKLSAALFAAKKFFVEMMAKFPEKLK